MSDKTFIKIISICLCGSLLFALIAFILGRGSAKGDDTSNSQSHSGSTYINRDGELIAPDGFDLIPQEYVGNWAIDADSHVLQSPRNPQITEQEAIEAELNSYIILAYANYHTSNTSEIWSPLYKITITSDIGVFEAEGIQSEGIQAEFGSELSICKIEVYNSDGVTIADTVFIINNSEMVYYGNGNYVFVAHKMEAVG